MSKKKIIIKAFLTAFCVLTGALSANAESCSSVGQTQNKYTASGCSYTTQTRTCCSNKQWSAWGAACPAAECTDGELKDCGSGECGIKKCSGGFWGSCETRSNRLGSTAANHDAYCTTGGHNVWCGAMVWLENMKCCGFTTSDSLSGNSMIDSSKCGNEYWGYACCAKSEYLYPVTNVGRLDWGDDGAVEYID